MTETSPIFSKTYTLMLWMLRHTEKFPKSERFRLAKQINDSLFSFQECLFRLVYAGDKQTAFTQADIELAKLKVYVRLSKEMALTTMKQYEYISLITTEIGRLLGGWKKTQRI